MVDQTAPRHLSHRLATLDDVPSLRVIVRDAIGVLQAPYLTPDQITSSRAIMGLDAQLVEDGTYFVVECDGEIVGCGGWSRRSTLYGNDATPGRDAACSTRRPSRPESARCTPIRDSRVVVSVA